MNESQITTATQLDAAIDAQHAARLASLQRQATTTGYLVWVALALLAIALVLIGAAYFLDRQVSPFALVGILLSSAGFVVIADASRRRRATKKLEDELRSRD